MATPDPWRVIDWQGREIASRSTRLAAMNVVDRPWRGGAWRVRHASTGETWLRHRGIWNRERDARPRQRTKGASAASGRRPAPQNGTLP